ncbi:MAG: hypothetical protein F6K62_19290 [Sphaerospermopsis sp. SIO1G2]|nr:hypothetical protein [Sphaerospermopsis sp. SIO1G2]
MAKMMNIYMGGVFINPDKTEAITSYGERINLKEKEVVTAHLEVNTVVVGWAVTVSETAVALVVQDNDEKNPYKGYVTVVFPDQIIKFDESTYN